jgi:hypothetical protein
VARVNGRAVRVQQILPLAKTELDRLPNDQRDAKKPEVVRRALQQYVDRELLLQEALARGVQANSAEVDWAYDQLRHEHPNDRAWADFLASQGMNPQALRAELRVQRTVAALLEQEVRKTLGENADETVRQQRQAEIGEALLARLRAKARIELFL